MIASFFAAVFCLTTLNAFIISTTEAATLCGSRPGDSCFTSYSSLDTGSSVSTYDGAADFCRNSGLRLAAIYTPEELAMAGKLMVDAGWSKAVIGLRRYTTAWQWALDALQLRGQGCGLNANSHATMQSTYYNKAMSVAKCYDFCSKTRSAQYFGLTTATLCYCTDSYIWTQASTSCAFQCAGAPQQLCGSFTSSSLYSIADAAYDNWKQGYPKTTGNCGAVVVDRSQNTWIDADCRQTMPFLCQFSVGRAAPTGYERRACSDGICFYLFTSETLSWFDADRYCFARNGRLASIGSQQRQDLVNAMVFDGTSLDGVKFWIGATRLDWLFDDRKSRPQFSGWLPLTQGKNFADNLTCVELVVNNSAVGWRSRPCEQSPSDENNFRFLCSKDSLSRTEALAAAAAARSAGQLFDSNGQPVPSSLSSNPYGSDGDGTIDGTNTVDSPWSSENGSSRPIPGNRIAGNNFEIEIAGNSNNGGSSGSGFKNSNDTSGGQSVSSAGENGSSIDSGSRSANSSTNGSGDQNLQVQVGDTGRQVASGQTKTTNDDSLPFPWYDILLIVLAFIAVVLAAVFVGLFLAARKKSKVNDRSQSRNSRQRRTREASMPISTYPSSTGREQTMLY